MGYFFASQSSTGTIQCMLPSHRVVIEVSQRKVDLSNSRLCRKWVECIDNDPLREFERKEEVGELLE